MFFSITPKPQTNFTYFYHIGPFVVSTDAGWQRHDADHYSCVYKGYAEDAPLPDLLDQIAQQTEPQLSGNFCVIMYDNRTRQLHVKSDRLRSFPIYYDEGASITNLRRGKNTVWSNGLISADNNLNITYTKFNLIGQLDQTPVTRQQVIEFADQRLSDKTEKFLKHNKIPVKVFLSGGVDTALVFSYIQKYTQDYELVKCNIVEYDRFWLQNSTDIGGQYWAYNQIHHWTRPSILSSGAPGDEFMLRNPKYADQYLKFHGIKIQDLLAQKTWLHSDYFGLAKHQEIFETQIVDTKLPFKALQWNLCNAVVNDWQHWHIGQTLNWTPLRDLEIYKMFLRLPAEVAIGQIMDSDVSLALIERNYPELLNVISDQKNSGNYLKNLADFLFGPAR